MLAVESPFINPIEFVTPINPSKSHSVTPENYRERALQRIETLTTQRGRALTSGEKAAIATAYGRAAGVPSASRPFDFDERGAAIIRDIKPVFDASSGGIFQALNDSGRAVGGAVENVAEGVADSRGTIQIVGFAVIATAAVFLVNKVT